MPVVLNVDQTPPTLSVSFPDPIFVGSNAVATPTATDATSGVASVSCDPLDTSTAGKKEIMCSATDHAGNVTAPPRGFVYFVLHAFSGYLPPISTDKDNQVRAGRAVPIKFSLAGDFGLNIMEDGYPASRGVQCRFGEPVDVEETQTLTAGSSSLSYDAATDVYTYIWKTEASWAGSCRLLIMQLNGGQTYTASFAFRN